MYVPKYFYAEEPVRNSHGMSLIAVSLPSSGNRDFCFYKNNIIRLWHGIYY